MGENDLWKFIGEQWSRPWPSADLPLDILSIRDTYGRERRECRSIYHNPGQAIHEAIFTILSMGKERHDVNSIWGNIYIYIFRNIWAPPPQHLQSSTSSKLYHEVPQITLKDLQPPSPHPSSPASNLSKCSDFINRIRPHIRQACRICNIIPPKPSILLWGYAQHRHDRGVISGIISYRPQRLAPSLEISKQLYIPQLITHPPSWLPSPLHGYEYQLCVRGST